MTQPRSAASSALQLTGRRVFGPAVFNNPGQVSRGFSLGEIDTSETCSRGANHVAQESPELAPDTAAQASISRSRKSRRFSFQSPVGLSVGRAANRTRNPWKPRAFGGGGSHQRTRLSASIPCFAGKNSEIRRLQFGDDNRPLPSWWKFNRLAPEFPKH